MIVDNSFLISVHQYFRSQIILSIILNNTSMSSFLKVIFGGQITQIIQKNKYIDVRVGSESLTKQLSTKRGQDILAKYLKTPENQHRYLRILTLSCLTLLYSDECYEVISEHLKVKCFTDNWISCQVLVPLANWIRKCCQTSHLFKLVKKNLLDISTIMDRLPYTIKLLREIVKIVNSLPKFGRYYNLKEEHQEYMMLAEVVMTLNNILYSHMKTSLQHFMSNETKENIIRHKEIIKWIFDEVLPEINEKIRFVTLSRHFNLYCKGIVTKLIESDLYDQKFQELLSQSSVQQRKKAKSLHYQSLTTKIFPGDGSFDEGLYLSALDDTRKFNKVNDLKLLLNSSTPSNRWTAKIRPKTKRY